MVLRTTQMFYHFARIKYFVSIVLHLRATLTLQFNIHVINTANY